MRILIQKQDFDLNSELDLIKTNNIGAIVSFIGIVRDIADDNLTKMVLEHYPKMTIKALTDIAIMAKKRWAIDDITIIHRIGSLKVSDNIVLVLVVSKHRTEAFNSCEFIMDYLKIDAPFWKKEYKSSGAHWVQANNIDSLKKNKWS